MKTINCESGGEAGKHYYVPNTQSSEVDDISYEDCVQLREAGLKPLDFIYKCIKGRCTSQTHCGARGLMTNCHYVYKPTLKELSKAYIELSKQTTTQHEARMRDTVEEILKTAYFDDWDCHVIDVKKVVAITQRYLPTNNETK